jgi:predicted DNA-binding protein
MLTNIEDIERARAEAKGRRNRKFSTRLSEQYHEALSRLAKIGGRTKTEILKGQVDLYSRGI